MQLPGLALISLGAALTLAAFASTRPASPPLNPPPAPSQEAPEQGSEALPPEQARTVVATIPDGYAFVHMEERPGDDPKKVYLPFAFSSGGERVAFYAAKKDRVYGFLDGESLGYASKGRRPVFTDSGEHVAMALGKVNKNRSESWKVFVDGKEVAKEDWVGALSISEDGNAVAYWTKPDYRLDPSGEIISNRSKLIFAKRKKKRFRQTASDEYSWALTFTAPLIDADGEVAYGTSYDDRRRGHVIAIGNVKDEIQSTREGYIRQYAITDDAGRVATVRRLIKENKRGYESTDTVTYPRYQLEVDGADLEVNADATALPKFSENGEHYAFVYLRDKAFGVGINGQLLPASENTILAAWPNSTGERVAWIEHRDGELQEDKWLRTSAMNDLYQGKSHLCYGWVIPGEGEEGPTLEDVEFSDPYDKIYLPTLSPDEQRIAFVGELEEQYYVVCGARRMGPFETVQRLDWADDTTVGAGTREGNSFVWNTLRVADE